MITVNIICVGKLKEQYWRDACLEYQKRLSAYCDFNIIEVAEHKLVQNATQGQISEGLEREGDAIISRLSKGGKAIALCIEGKKLSSEGLAAMLQEVSCGGISKIDFIIGSSHGLADKVKKIADFRISMSDMTFPHQLARVLLCEQVYRAFSINNNSKYHK